MSPGTPFTNIEKEHSKTFTSLVLYWMYLLIHATFRGNVPHRGRMTHTCSSNLSNHWLR